MRLTLQEMVAGAIAEATAREKLAQETASEKKEEAASAKNGNGNGNGNGKEGKAEEASEGPAHEAAEPKGEENKEKEGAGLKCASAPTPLVEKVASALDFINGHMGLIDWTKIAQENEMGPGTGPGSVIETNLKDPTPGTQNYETGQATPQAQPPTTIGSDSAKKQDGQTNAETSIPTDMTQVPGGTGEQPQLKQASIKIARRLWAMKKHAEDAINPAKIEAGSEPLVNPNASASEEGVPKLPGPAQAQANMVQTKDPTAPADITKRDTKAEPKRQMGEVLDEPAQKKSTDPVLQNNLSTTEQAGVKISAVRAAAARAYLRKIAQAGESPEATPEEKEKAQKLKEAVEEKLEAKKNGGNGNGEEDEEEKKKESQFGDMGSQMPQSTPPAAPAA
jgi:hypothetical protein